MKEVMEKYSTTFFECVAEWPDNIKVDIYRLYAYLRAMDEIVEHNYFHPQWKKICEEFEKVEQKYNFDKQWSKDFDKSMISDLHIKKHTTTSMIEYCKGSGEAVGLMIARILGCPPEADDFARSLGRAYQIINFVRDYDDDVSRGYHYIGEDHSTYINMFKNDLDYASQGMIYIPEHLRGPIIKANQMYLSLIDNGPTWDNMWICNCEYGHQNCKCDGKTGKKVRE